MNLFSKQYMLVFFGFIAFGLFTALVYGSIGSLRRWFSSLGERRRARSSARRESTWREGGDASPRRDNQLPADTLVKVWRRFLRGLPWRHRPSVADYPLVVMLGPAGAGKSRLVDGQVDWQAQKKRFFPSVTDDALLQVYIGSRVIVQELSPGLLGDDSAEARRALKRLWRTSASRRPPGVLVALDAAALGRAAPEELRRQAQLVRGKLDLLQELHGRPMRVSVCLTHMDGFTGFAELAGVAGRAQLPLAVDLRPLAKASDGRLFAQHEDYLGLALTASPSESFSRVVELMSGSGGIRPMLATFLSPLVEKSRLQAPPDLDRLFFFSPEVETDRMFVAPSAGERKNGLTSPRVLRLAAAGGVMAVLLGAAHCNHARKLDAADAAVARYEQLATRPAVAASASAAELRGALEHADAALTAVHTAEGWWPPLKLSSRAHKRQLAARLVGDTRGAYLLPLLRSSALPGREPILYLLGLLYAARDNALGEWIAPRAHHWASNLGLPDIAVAAYIRWSEHGWGDPVALVLIAESDDPMLSLRPWAEFFNALQVAYDSQDVATDLKPLQARAAALADALDRSRKFSEVPTMLQLLPQYAPLDLNALLRAPRRDEALSWIEQNRPSLEGLLAMITQGDLSPGLLGRMMLGALVAHVNQLLAKGGNELFAFKLDRQYAFSRQRWSELLARAAVQVFVRQPGYPFLPREAGAVADPARAAVDPTRVAYDANRAGNYDATRVAPDASRAAVPGGDVYHRALVDGSVRPALDDFTKKLAASPLGAADKATLDAYVQAQANAYAQHYREALFAAYQPYHLDVRTAADLPPAITQLIQPSGGFMRWLRGVAEDADLGALDSVYLRPLADAVAPLQPIVRLIKPAKDGSTGELGKYISLVTRLSRELAGTERSNGGPGGAYPTSGGYGTGGYANGGTGAYGGGYGNGQYGGGGYGNGGTSPSGGGGEGLSRFLSPVAKVTMGMMLEPNTSYLAQASQWLAELGVSDELKTPFLEPFNRVLDFGVPELEGALKQQWARTWALVSPMFAKYPFQRRAAREVEPNELDALKEGGGSFWSAFRDIAPFCVQRGESWSPRGPLLRPLALPAGMLGRLGLMTRLARTYFDKDGKRAPLALTVTPLPLPKELDREGYVTMSFLRAGGASVFGFNQAPIGRSFAPAWWSGEGASIGIMFGEPFRDPDPKITPDRSLDASASPWAIYRLVEKASSVGDTVVWTLPGDGYRRRTVPIRFVMRGDAVALHPWTLFSSARD